MPKFLYFTDTHIRGQNSSNYVGDYYTDIMTSIDEIIKLSIELKADKVLCGGDLFDSNLVSNIIVDELIDKIEEAEITWQCIRGNHDEINGNPALSKASSLDHCFRRSKFIQPLIWEEGKNYMLVGQDYVYGIEQNIKDQGLYFNKLFPKIKDTPGKWKILVVHAFFTIKPFLPQVLHIDIHNINTDFHLILSGHNHQDWGKKIIDETIYCNPGGVGRLDVNEGDIKPSVVLIDTEKQTVELIPLKSIKPKEEIFDLDKIENKKEFESTIEGFINSINTTKFKSLDLIGIVSLIGKENNIEKEVMEDLIKRLGLTVKED